MSRRIKLENIDEKNLKKIGKDLVLEIKPSRYAPTQTSRYLPLYYKSKNYLYVPFSYDSKISRPSRENLGDMKVEFALDLRPEQEEVKTDAISMLNKKGSTLISCYTGFGKTCLAIYLATTIKLRTMIITHRVVLINQWKSSILKFCPNANVQIITSKTKEIHNDTNFCIMNATNVCKHKLSFYKSIGLLIVDEAHCIMAEKVSQCMRYFLPRYVIGLTATPYRFDGLNGLLDNYFGTEKIIRKLYRHHTVYKVKTNFKPNVELTRNGKPDWNSVLNSQALSEERNGLIIDIIQRFSDRIFLVLCKRVDQAKYLVSELKSAGEDVTSLIGNKQTFEYKSRILIGTCQKTGVGFDHPRLDTLLLAADVEQYFVQYLGRVFRRKDVEPIIFDLVDDYVILEKHYKTRRKTYIEHGGKIKTFS